jgi:hypothetical protein
MSQTRRRAADPRRRRIAESAFIPSNQEYHVDLTLETKCKILVENTVWLYGIDIATQSAELRRDGIAIGG